jgi:hypothetical protein
MAMPWDRAEAGTESGLDKASEEDRLEEANHERHGEQRHPINRRWQVIAVEGEEELDYAQNEPQTDRLLPVLCGQAEIGERTTTHPDGVDHRPENTQDEAGGVAEKQPQRPVHCEHLERQIEGGNNSDVQQKDSTNVPAINMPASTRHQPRRKKHEQTSAQRNDQAIDKTVADGKE